jgi:hypothetical protein
MARRMFGEYLARVVPISRLDVAEILEDQAASGRRFGEIALSWGLCEPRHVWEAWASQLEHHCPAADLLQTGVDYQAARELPARLAWRYGAVAVRKVGEKLVVAADEATVARASARLPALLKRKVHFVVAPPAQIAAALRTYYPLASRTN